MDAEDDDIDYDYDIDYDVITTSTPEPGAKLKKPKLVDGSKLLQPRPAAGVLSGDKSTNNSAISNDRAKRDAKSKDSPSPTSSV